jgi:hypothetical protein
MKYLLFIILFLLSKFSFGQNIPNTKTIYSKTDNESAVKDDRTFYMTNGYMYQIENLYGTRSNFGPLVLNNTGNTEEGYYYEYFTPNFKSSPLEFIGGKEILVYKIIYNEYGGDILQIIESKSRNQQTLYIKYFFTYKGYYMGKEKSKGNSYNLKEDKFDINSVVLNSTDLNQIMSKINFSFEQFGDKKLSDDGNYVTVQYKNNSLIYPLITYSKNGDVIQIVLMMPLDNLSDLYDKLQKKYGYKIIKGEMVIQNGDLIFDLKYDDDIGYIIIY